MKVRLNESNPSYSRDPPARGESDATKFRLERIYSSLSGRRELSPRQFAATKFDEEGQSISTKARRRVKKMDGLERIDVDHLVTMSILLFVSKYPGFFVEQVSHGVFRLETLHSLFS